MTRAERPEEPLDGFHHRALEVEQAGLRGRTLDRLPDQQAVGAAVPQRRVAATLEVVATPLVPDQEHRGMHATGRIAGG